jgi:hypothetical protein
MRRLKGFLRKTKAFFSEGGFTRARYLRLALRSQGSSGPFTLLAFVCCQVFYLSISPRLPPPAQLDPHIARAPIVLCKEEAEADPVVQWIRAEFSKLDQVPSATRTRKHG